MADVEDRQQALPYVSPHYTSTALVAVVLDSVEFTYAASGSSSLFSKQCVVLTTMMWAARPAQRWQALHQADYVQVPKSVN